MYLDHPELLYIWTWVFDKPLLERVNKHTTRGGRDDIRELGTVQGLLCLETFYRMLEKEKVKHNTRATDFLICWTWPIMNDDIEIDALEEHLWNSGEVQIYWEGNLTSTAPLGPSYLPAGIRSR